jgi:hypothetical protein
VFSATEGSSQAPAKLLRRDSSLRKNLTDGFDLSRYERLKPFDIVLCIFQECRDVQINHLTNGNPEVPW